MDRMYVYAAQYRVLWFGLAILFGCGADVDKNRTLFVRRHVQEATEINGAETCEGYVQKTKNDLETFSNVHCECDSGSGAAWTASCQLQCELCVNDVCVFYGFQASNATIAILWECHEYPSFGNDTICLGLEGSNEVAISVNGELCSSLERCEATNTDNSMYNADCRNVGLGVYNGCNPAVPATDHWLFFSANDNDGSSALGDCRDAPRVMHFPPSSLYDGGAARTQRSSAKSSRAATVVTTCIWVISFLLLQVG